MTVTLRTLAPEVRLTIRDRLRNTRLAALANAEDFVDIVQTLEQLGQLLCGEQRSGFGQYQTDLHRFATSHSCLAAVYEKQSPHLHCNLNQMMNFVREGRNDSVHSGVFARKVVSHAIDLSLVLEDALMPDGAIADFMVRDVITAEFWQPLSFIRRLMLEHSFSYLPIFTVEHGWRVVSDGALVQYLRRDHAQRRERLSETLLDACGKQSGGLELLTDVHTCEPDEKLEKIVDHLRGRPVLVVRSTNRDSLLGIVTAFDLL